MAPTAAQRARLLVVPPEIDSKVKQLSAEITAGSFTQAEQAFAITNYLLSNYKYSLDYRRGDGDPISDFLLNKRAAHCQYFASGAVMLLRSAGIPARYVTGYYAHEEESLAHTIVRTRDAHAWAEAYLAGLGWVVVEATPPDGRADPRANPIPWHQQRMEELQDAFARVRNWLGRLTRTQVLGLLGSILLLWGLERWRQMRKKAHATQGPVPPLELAPIAKRFERVLSKRGIQITPEKPWSEAVPEGWSAAQEFVQAYNQARFNVATVKDLEELQRLLTAAEKAVPEATLKDSKT